MNSVLKVMESDRIDACRYRGDTGQDTRAKESNEARAAVAEAFDVLRGVRAELVALNMREDGTQRNSGSTSDRIRQIDATLARVGAA